MKPRLTESLITASEPRITPDGWSWVRFGDITEFQNGRAFPGKEYCTEGTRLLRPGNLFADGSVRWTEKNTQCLPLRWADDHPAMIVRGGELVMNLTAQSLKDEFLGRVCLTSSGELCLLNQRLARITPSSALDARFVLYALKSHVFRRFVNQLNTGSLIQHMYTTQLGEFRFPLAPLNEQRRIVGKIEELFSDLEAGVAYTEQITFLLFLKMADEMTKPPYSRPPIVPAKHGWQTLLKYEGDELEVHYRHTLEELGKQPGMLGEIFKKARSRNRRRSANGLGAVHRDHGESGWLTASHRRNETQRSECESQERLAYVASAATDSCD